MKIGIITLPLNYNYGGLLQTFALQSFLERNGHKVEVIDRPYRPYIISNKKKLLVYIRRFVHKYFLGDKNIRIASEDYYNKTYKYVCKNTDRFINTYIHRRLINNFSEISSGDYDAFVVGSDQIWRVSYNIDIYDSYLLFAKHWNVKKIAYAVSFGTDIWEYSDEQTKKCKELVELFDAISIRELSGVQLVKNYFKVNVPNVLDPTMLFSQSFYDNLLNVKEIKSKGDIMLYILDRVENLDENIRSIAYNNKLTFFYANSKINELGLNVKLEERVQPSVEEWLYSIKTAKFVITDSFHACVFSILYNKNFVVVGNMARGLSRIYSVLNLFGLMDRYAASYSDIENILFTDIDYRRVNSIVARMRDFSSKFLLSNLK